jgi:carboxymethylenebutenolidase
MSTEPQLGVVLVGLPPGAPEIERYTAHGYAVLVPEVRDPADVEGTLHAVRSAMEALTARAPARKVAVVGYGLGGRYAFLAAVRLGAAAAGVFYGSDIGGHLGEAAGLATPMTFHFGDADERVPFEEVRKIKGALEGFATTEIYRYPGARHGFALRGDPAYDAGAAEAAERRVFAVLDSLCV